LAINCVLICNSITPTH